MTEMVVDDEAWKKYLPKTEYLLAFPDSPYDRGYTTTQDGYSEEQMLAFAATILSLHLTGEIVL